MPIYPAYHTAFDTFDYVKRFVDSDFSPEVSYYSSGSAPNQPDAPSLRDATAHSLHLEWDKSTGEINGYILEMEDDMKVGNGFKSVALERYCAGSNKCLTVV